MKIGIVGVGMVGSALRDWFVSQGTSVLLHDTGKGIGSVPEVNQADIVFVAVPTPFDEQKGFDLSMVESVIAALEGNKTVVIKSTVLPGTTDLLQKKYAQHLFLFSPEFLTEATAKEDMEHPDRQIVGYTRESKSAAQTVMSLLPQAPFARIMKASEAEMVKYFSNTWYAVKVAFANQMYDVCQKAGVNYDTVKEAAAADHRIGASHLEVWHKGYRGYGGKCLPKDMKAFIQFADSKGLQLPIHQAAEEVNQTLSDGRP